MNFNRDKVCKAIICSPLLPPPGNEEVKKFAEDWLEQDDEITRLRAEITHLRAELAAERVVGDLVREDFFNYEEYSEREIDRLRTIIFDRDLYNSLEKK